MVHWIPAGESTFRGGVETAGSQDPKGTRGTDGPSAFPCSWIVIGVYHPDYCASWLMNVEK